MARSTQEILNEINSEADKVLELKELQANTSKVSFWNFIKNIIAFQLNYLERLFDQLKNDINKIIENTEIGTREWYISQVLKYQHGDKLIINNNIIGYPVINDEKKIIKKCGICETENNGEILVKVLKVNNNLLSPDEKAGLESYLNKVKIIGTKIKVISIDADLINLDILIQVNKEVIGLDGVKLSSGNKIIEDTINDFIKNIPFDSIFYLSKLEDALQLIEGVEDVYIKSSQYFDGNKYDDFIRKYEPKSGWIKTNNLTIKYE